MATIDPWAWHAHPEVWALMLGLLAAYALALTRSGPRHLAPGAPVVTGRQIGAFVTGVALLWIASDWPIHDLAEHYLYSVHMLEHELITLAAPPLLLIGTPDWLQRVVLARRPLSVMATWASKPVVAGVVFNAGLVAFHAPPVVDFTLRHHGLHFFAHVLMFATALIMWWPVVNRLEEYGRMSYPAKFLYLFLMTVVPDIPIFFLALSPAPLFSFYAGVPRPFSLSAVGDQQLAAGLMNLTNILFFGIIAAVMFFRWWAQEDVVDRKLRSDETLTWDDVRTDLERASRPEFRTKRSS